MPFDDDDNDFEEEDVDDYGDDDFEAGDAVPEDEDDDDAFHADEDEEDEDDISDEDNEDGSDDDGFEDDADVLGSDDEDDGGMDADRAETTPGGGMAGDTAYPQTHTFVPMSLPEFVACTSMRTQMLAQGAPTTLSPEQKAVLRRELRKREGESMQHWDEVRMLAEWRVARLPIQSLRRERETDVGTLINANNVGDMLAFRPRHDWALLATHLWVLQIPDPIMSQSPERDARILI